ncbi:MAG: amidohydrolase family protein [Ignavibacteria bacterium]|nr:amidohydrolase family protein [Ignavibacteria bacterium]
MPIVIILLLLLTAPVTSQITTRPIDGLRTKNVHLIAYTNCTVVPEPGKKIDSAVIMVRDGKIVSVGKGLSIPEGAQVRNLRGAWVYAGFIEPFADNRQFGGRPAQPKKMGADHEDEDEGPNTPGTVGAHHWNMAVRPERAASSTTVVSSADATKLNALGFTAATVSTHDGIFRGTSSTIILTEGPAASIVVADRVAQNMSFVKGSSATPYPSSLMGSIALIRQTFFDAAWYTKAHNSIESFPTHKRPEFNIGLAALSQSVSARQLFLVEAQDEHDFARWKRIADEVGITLAYKGTGNEYRRLNWFAANNSTIILPLELPEVPDVRNPVEARAVSLNDLMHWYWSADNAKLLDSVGCTLAFTTTGMKVPADYLVKIRKMVEQGLKPETALAALTTVPARLGEVDRLLGKVAENYIANLVIASGDLFKEKSVIRSVVVQGMQSDVNEAAGVDMRGHWTLNSSEFSKPIKVSIAGTAEKPTITAKVDTLNMLVNLTVGNGRISMSLETDSIGTEGVYRTTFRADSILVSTDLISPTGSVVQMVMRRDSVFKELPPKKPDPQPRKPLPKIYPLGPYGLAAIPEQNNVVLKNATVWTCGTSGILENTDVLISNGKIAGIGKGLSAPLSIDCSGKHITPGIIDEHSHIAISRGVNEGTHAITTEVRIGDVVDPDDVNIYRQLAGGVTASHLLHGSANPMGGQLQFIKLRWGSDAEQLKVQGATPTVKFALGENVKQSNWGDRFTVRYPQSRMGVEQLMRDAFQAAREYEAEMKAASVGGIPVRRDIQLDALVEILNSKRNIHCHSYVQSEILMLMRLTEEFGFRVHTFTHILEGYKVAKEMAKHGARASSFSDWWAYKFEVYDAIPENTGILHAAGVVTSVNSDDGEMARRLNQEAAKSVKYGNVSEVDAMKFVTLNSAKQMGVEDRMGSIETGKDGDVVVWSGNPLSNMSRAERTFVDGREMFSIEADLKLRSRDSELRRFLEQEAMAAIAEGAASAKPKKKQRKEYHCETWDDEVKTGLLDE